MSSDAEEYDVIDQIKFRHGRPSQVDIGIESGFKFGLGFGCASIVIVLLTWAFVAAVGASAIVSFMDFLGSMG
ncbi:MAG: hypothetical protein OXG47_07105 [bacterium]|nr:hypothetical protein [bacterium]